jgi:hypothetical protein
VDTLGEVLDRLAGLGYVDDVVPAPGGVRCLGSGSVTSVGALRVDEIVRLEGDSDPDDELIVYALTCAACGRRATFVAKFGPDTTPDETALIRALATRHA